LGHDYRGDKPVDASCEGGHCPFGRGRSSAGRRSRGCRDRRRPRRAHKILVSAYHMLAKGLAYRDLGEAYHDQIGQSRTVANLKRRPERLGYHVTLKRTTQAA
jgi:hypothetical protein